MLPGNEERDISGSEEEIAEQKHLHFCSVIAQLDWSPRSPQRARLSAGATRRGEAIQEKGLGYPVNPPEAEDNDNYWNRVRYQNISRLKWR
jgi:hypothetical protein